MIPDDVAIEAGLKVTCGARRGTIVKRQHGTLDWARMRREGGGGNAWKKPGLRAAPLCDWRGHYMVRQTNIPNKGEYFFATREALDLVVVPVVRAA